MPMKSQQYGCLNKTCIITIPVNMPTLMRIISQGCTVPLDKELQEINCCVIFNYVKMCDFFHAVKYYFNCIKDVTFVSAVLHLFV